MKKSVIAVMCFALLFAIPFASAGFWSWITGKAVQPANVTIEVGNTAPTIPLVQTISAQDPRVTDLIIGYTDVIFNFTAQDHDGYADLNPATAFARFTEPGETERNASCSAIGGEAGGEYQNYTCTVRMWYWDKGAPTEWERNVSIKDDSAIATENSTTTVTYNSLTAFEMSPSTLTWPPSLTPGQTDVKSNNDPSILNNTGNFVSLDIEINATDLNGTGVRPALFIDANDFAASGTPDDECIGDTLSTSAFILINYENATAVVLPRGNLSIGAGTAQANLYYCLKTVNSALVKQSYTTAANGAWTVKIV